MIKKFLVKNSKTVTHGAILIATSQLLSRVLGLLRDGLFARAFSTTSEAGIYFAAFKIPDFIYNFLVAGGLSIVFLPLFAQYWHKEGKEKAWEMANYVINAIAIFISLASLICFIFTPLLLKIFIPGFSAEQLAMAVPLTRLLLISPIFMGVSSLLSSALMHFDNFVSYSLAPILYNLSIIFGIVFLAPTFGVFGVGIGVILGAILHLAVQLPGAFHNGYKFKPVLNFKIQALKDMYRLALPRIIATSSQQLDDLLTTGIVSIVISVSAISILAYAYNLQYIPIGLFAMPLAISVFPVLSRLWEAQEKQKFFETFSNVFKKITFFATPFAVLFFVFRAQIVRLLYETIGNIGKQGNFSKEAVILTSACLGIYALSTLFTSFIPLFVRAFFSTKDTKVPTLISVFAIVIDIAFSWIFPVLIKSNNNFANFVAKMFDLEIVKDFSIIGVPMALLLSSVIQIILLWYFFVKIYGDFGVKKIFDFGSKILIASIFAGLGSYLVLFWFPKESILEFVAKSPAIFLFIKTATAGTVGVLIYLIFCYVLRIPELKGYMDKLKNNKNGN